MSTAYYQENKERLRKEACERYENLSGEEKTKSEKRLVKDIKVFLKEKKKKSVSIVANAIKIFPKMKNNE